MTNEAIIYAYVVGYECGGYTEEKLYLTIAEAFTAYTEANPRKTWIERTLAGQFVPGILQVLSRVIYVPEWGEQGDINSYEFDTVLAETSYGQLEFSEEFYYDEGADDVFEYVHNAKKERG